jgi:hypothetical protein
MSNRRVVAVAVMLLIGVVCAEDRVQSELRFAAHSKDEKTAGVWVDGQYVGFVKELAGDKKLMLLPGKHEIVIRQAWYDEFVKQVILEPGADPSNQRHLGEIGPDADQGRHRRTENSRHPFPRGGFCRRSIRRTRRRV